MNKLSGIILTHNNERTIKDSVDSIKNIIDELIIIDDFSTDRTIDIIKSIYPAVKIFHRKLDRFDYQRNFGIEKASYDWILMIDSDEAAGEVLSNAIKKELDAPKSKAYGCFGLNAAFGETTKEKMSRPILFEKKLRFTSALHENIPGIKLRRLNGMLIHNSWVSLEKWVEKMNAGSSRHAEKWLLEKRGYGRLQLFLLVVLMPAYGFIEAFFFQKYFLRPLRGIFYASTKSFYWVLVIAKYYELKYNKITLPQSKKNS